MAAPDILRDILENARIVRGAEELRGRVVSGSKPTAGPELAAHARVVPLLKAKTALKGKATAYVCEKRTCELPTSDPEVFARQLRKARPYGS